jgi:polyisoprenoid-binding protein YceI
MRKSPWFALSLLLCTGPVQAQSQPAASPKPAAAAPKPNAAPAQPATAASAPAGAAEKQPTPTKDKPAPAANSDKNVEWALDASHSQIGFVARHLGFSKTNGHFNKYDAVVRADPKSAKLASLEATVDAASIDTGIDKRDKHLRSEDFLNTDKFPQLKLTSKSFKWNGNKFTAVVDLTIRDVTKPVTFKGELLGVHKVNFGQGEQLRAGYEASATINRKDFGLTWNMVTEGLSVVAR